MASTATVVMWTFRLFQDQTMPATDATVEAEDGSELVIGREFASALAPLGAVL
jgi:hypothetical protein